MRHWRISRQGRITRFCLETPDGKQRLTPAILEELAALAAAEAERGQRVVAIRSLSKRLFAAGADLTAIRALDPSAAFAYAKAGQEALASLADVRALLIAEVGGACFGGAVDLALACDIRVACECASFSHPGVRLGIVTGWGGTRLVRYVSGIRAARRLFLEGRILTAAEAHGLGLVDRVFGARGWHRSCRDLERRLAADGDLGQLKLSVRFGLPWARRRVRTARSDRE
jgi:enoyl-CoA hydratase